MNTKAIAVEELKDRTLAEVLEQVVSDQRTLTVILAHGEMMEIRPAISLKPLPELPGSVPKGWKEAIYDR